LFQLTVQFSLRWPGSRRPQKAKAGLGDIAYPLVADLKENNRLVPTTFSDEDAGVALRGPVHHRCPDGIVQHATMQTIFSVGRNVDETLRVLHGLPITVCGLTPVRSAAANWTAGRTGPLKPVPSASQRCSSPPIQFERPHRPCCLSDRLASSRCPFDPAQQGITGSLRIGAIKPKRCPPGCRSRDHAIEPLGLRLVSAAHLSPFLFSSARASASSWSSLRHGRSVNGSSPRRHSPAASGRVPGVGH